MIYYFKDLILLLIIIITIILLKLFKERNENEYSRTKREQKR
jgi:hypothetical protein